MVVTFDGRPFFIVVLRRLKRFSVGGGSRLEFLGLELVLELELARLKCSQKLIRKIISRQRCSGLFMNLVA